MRTCCCGELREGQIGSTVSLCGWVSNRRDHGGVIFIDLRDRTGRSQVVVDPDTPDCFSAAEMIRSEYVLRIVGVVRARPEGTKNEDLSTGGVEVLVKELEVLSVSRPPPFAIDDPSTHEDTRLKYRFFDLKSERMVKNLSLRSVVYRNLRSFLDSKDFQEIETPILSKATPEGARDYLVPSRTQQGKFFALPQSPQLYKQLLMMSGADKYYQIVRCFRDEDLRADRQPEFTQLDIEMSFVSERDIMNLMEDMIDELFDKVLSEKLKRPFPKISYSEAIDKYGTDRPDLRNPLFLVEMSKIFKDCDFKVFSIPASSDVGRVAALRVPDSVSILSRKQIDDYTEQVIKLGAKGLAYIKVNDLSKGIAGLQSPILKFLNEEIVQSVLELSSADNGDIIFFGAGDSETVNQTMAALSSLICRDLKLEGARWAPLWVVDFPMFEKDQEGNLSSTHHPFTAPNTEISNVIQNPLSVTSRAYDMVLNGNEIGGGSVRIHNKEIQTEIFKLLGLDKRTAEEKFGFFTDAMDYGCPPHGGIAFGLDRLVMLMANENSIRDVIAFPKTQAAGCQLTSAPSAVDEKQLEELAIKLKKVKK